jgi:hypothetical protein
MSFFSISTLATAGPNVQIIFVFLKLTPFFSSCQQCLLLRHLYSKHFQIFKAFLKTNTQKQISFGAIF